MIKYPYGQHLPIFPTIHREVREDRLERTIERLMDRADAALLDGRATQTEYDLWVNALDIWAKTVTCVRADHLAKQTRNGS